MDDVSELRIDKQPSSSDRNRRKSLLRWLPAAAVLIIAVVLYFSGVIASAPAVEVFLVPKMYPSQTFTLLNASGYVVAQRKAAVASKVTGRLIQLSVEEGDRVEKGRVLAALEHDDALALREQAAANLRSAEGSLDIAKAELHDADLGRRRSDELNKKGYVSHQDFDSADTRYKKAAAAVKSAEDGVSSARAALKNAELSVEYALIRAPFDAVVLTKNADIGDIVTPLGAAANARASVVTLADMKSLQAEVDVSEANIGKVKKGQPCEIQLDALPDIRFRGHVHMIVPTADRSKATVLVKVAFAAIDSRVLPEMSAKVAFLEHEVSEAEALPKTAIRPEVLVMIGGLQSAFVLKGDQLELVQVKTGSRLGDMVEVTGGLKPGDKVVVRPSGKLKSGMRVKVADK